MASQADSENKSLVESNIKSEDDDKLDPRIQTELERLNHAGEAVNHLELQLDDARKSLEEFWDMANEDLAQLEKSIGSAVSKARNYYDARIQLREAKEILTKAKHRFERAQTLYVAAKELAAVSADHIEDAEKLNQNAASWNETYDHALEKAADAERDKYEADLEQQRAEQTYAEIAKLVEKFQKSYRRAINKSQPYYEKQAEYHKEIDFQKRKVLGLENCVNEAKAEYKASLRNLEKISNEIHAQRNHGKLPSEIGERTDNVGEEPVTYTEFNTLSSSSTKDGFSSLSNTYVTKRLNRPEQLLRSCLLRTEKLPAGIFANISGRTSPEVDAATPTNNNNDEFLMNSQATNPVPPQIVIIDPDKQSAKPISNSHARKPSDGYSSQITDDEEDKTSSLHALSDEQLEHLTSIYHPLPLPLPETDAIDQLILQVQNSKLQAKAFLCNLFKNNTVQK